MPNEGEHFYMLAMLPRLEAGGVEGASSGGGGEGGEGGESVEGDAESEGGGEDAADVERQRKHVNKATRAKRRAMARQAARGGDQSASSGGGDGQVAR